MTIFDWITHLRMLIEETTTQSGDVTLFEKEYREYFGAAVLISPKMTLKVYRFQKNLILKRNKRSIEGK
jgi:hypothetical protein